MEMDWLTTSAPFDYLDTRWGSFHSVASYQRDGHKVKVKHLLLDEGNNISYQKHEHRAEVWNILSGKGTMVVQGITFEVKQGDVINIPLGCWHTVKADDNSRLEVLELQFGSETEESDIIRSHYEWKDILEHVKEVK